MHPVRTELRKLAALSAPAAASQLSTMLLGVVDTLMVSRVGVEAIAAAALANVWIFGTIMVANGVVLGIDPLVAQAHGARDGEAAGRALQRGLVLALIWSVPVGLLWSQTGTFLRWTGQEPALAQLAQDFTTVQIPTIPCFLGYVALRSYLQGRELMRPALWVILIANVFNAFGNWVLIYGHLGMPPLGLVGSGIATSTTRLLAFVGLVAWVRVFQLHRGAWVPWSRAAYEPRALAAVMTIGLPVALQIGLEIWAFSGSAVLVGWLGASALAAHTITLNMAALAFMAPLGIAQGTVTRVGNLIGAGDLDGAQRAGWIAIAMGAGVMSLSAVLFVTARHLLPLAYTDVPEVTVLAATILPIAGAFQIFDGTQVVAAGVLRGMGRTRPGAVFNFIAFWVIGLPLGAWLAFRDGYALAGIWYGLSVGLAVVAALLLVWVYWYGPASLVRPARDVPRREPTTPTDEAPLPDTVEVPIEDAIDLHFFAPGDIPSVVEAYLDAAAEAGFAEVRVIHGRGKGVQRMRVQRLLAGHPLVARFADAPPERGGTGATLVWLRPDVSRGRQGGPR
jgi:MATE family multidrug resistance protein